MQEAPLRSLSEVVEGLDDGLAAWLSMPFAFFGHSMGATIALELTRRVQARLGVQPQCLFLSGRRAPGRPEPAPIHDLPEPQFVEEIRRLSGTPEELLAHPEIRGLLVPLLRADFALIETCASADRSPLDCPIVGLGGLEDPRASREDVLAWRELTSGNFSLEMLPGDHFFLNRSRTRLLQIIASHLIGEVRAPGNNWEPSARACGAEG
jgi:medium-chain acyl-[acyl-carrier-protein] hydrolase